MLRICNYSNNWNRASHNRYGNEFAPRRNYSQANAHVALDKCSAHESACHCKAPVLPPTKVSTPKVAVATTTPVTESNLTQAPTVASFYRRQLPSHLVAFESTEGKRLFKEAMEAGYMEGYFSLASQFHTQSDPAYCGLGTLTMVLNALSVDPERVWKGVWRWFSEELLNCCTPLEVVKNRGLTFAEFVCLARCNAATVKDFYASKTSLEAFRNAIKSSTSRPEGEVVVASYDRGTLGQTGTGHFSPIGGYHPAKDIALIMDVARFKYPPHWVPVPLLFEAMKPIDENTGKERGYMVVTNGGQLSTFCRIKASTKEWDQIAHELWQKLPAVIQAAQPTTLFELIESFFAVLQDKTNKPSFLSFFGTYQADLLGKMTTEHKQFLDNLYKEIHNTRCFNLVSEVLEKSNKILVKDHVDKELVTIIMLGFPPQLFVSFLSDSLRKDYEQLQSIDGNSMVGKEIAAVRDTLSKISDYCHTCGLHNVHVAVHEYIGKKISATA